MAGKLTYSRVVSTLALVLAVGTGGAWAASELGRNAVKSKHIKDGAVKQKDLAKKLIASLRGVEGPAGPQGAPGPQGLPGIAGSARAYGRVGFEGQVTLAKNVAGNATGDLGNEPENGVFCIPLDPSIDASTAVVVTQSDFTQNGTGGWSFAWAQPDTSLCDKGNSIGVRTGLFKGPMDEYDVNADRIDHQNQPFFFMVP